MINYKITFPIFFLLLIASFLLGRLTANKVQKITTQTTQATVSTQKTEVITQATVQKDSTTSQQTSYIEKFYSPKGILTHEIIKGDVIGTSLQIVSTKDRTYVENHKETSKSQSTTVTTYDSNFEGGFLFNPSEFTKPKLEDVNLVLSYRLIGNVWLIGETNYKLTSQIGILVPL